ncbi:MAG: glycosyltransferase family 39 protein [Terracidiphilus sp.]
MFNRYFILSFRSGLILSIILALLSLTLSALIVRGHISIGSLTYGYLTDTVRMVREGNLSSFDPDRLVQGTRFPFADPLSDRAMNASDPFGYNIALALPLLLRIDPINCALLVNIISIVLSIVVFYLICALLFQPTAALGASVIFALNRLFLQINYNLGPEPIFVLTILAATFFLLKRYINYNRPSVRIAISLGVLVTLPVYVRYIGIVFTFIAILFILGETFIRRKTKGVFRETLALIATSAILVILLMAHNYAASGVLSGHPIGISPAYTFPQALFHMLVDIYSDTGLPLSAFFGPYVSVIIAFLVSTVFLLVLLLASVRYRNVRLFAWFTSAYVIAFAVSESITRIDLIDVRFIYPIFPFVVLGTFFLVHEARTLITSQRSVKVLTLCFILICSVSILLSTPLITRGRQSEYNYSPQTIRAVMASFPPNENIFVSRYGAQISIYRPDLHSHMLPFVDPGNGHYTEAYGIHLLTRDEFIDEMKIFGIHKIVFCLGRTVNGDGFIENDYYGAFMKDIFSGHDQLVENIQYLPDGRIITLRNN